MLQYSAEQVLEDKPVTAGGAIEAFSSAAVGQFAGEAIGVGLFGTPSAKMSMLRVNPSDLSFDSAGSGLSPLFYRSYPEMAQILQYQSAAQAFGETGRDVVLNVSLDRMRE